MRAASVLLQSMLWRGLYYVAAFIINILIARHFEASVSGAIYYISSIYALILLFFSLSLESGIVYFSARAEIPAGRLFNFSILWSLLVGLLSFFVVAIFFRSDYQGIPAKLLLVSAVLFISGNLLTTYCTGFFSANKDFKTPNIIVISVTIILIALVPYKGRSLVPAINDDNYFYVYFGAYFVQGIGIAIAAKIKYLKAGMLRFLSMQQFKMLLRYCMMAFAGNIIFFLLYRLDYFFVERYCSAEQLGNYIQVSKLAHLFFILPTILAGVVFPLTAGAQQAHIDRLLTMLSRSIFLLYLVVCLLLALTGQWLFPFVFGESFTDMYQPFLWLIPGILSLSGIYTLTAYFAGKDRIHINITGSVYALAVIIIGDILLIPLFGIQAAAAVSSVGYIVYQVYIINMFRKEYPVPLRDFFIFRAGDWKQIKKKVGDSINKHHES